MSELGVLVICLVWFVMGFITRDLVEDWREWFPIRVVPRRRADPDCPECGGMYVTATSQGNKPCSLCGTTEQDIRWDEPPFL